MEARVPDSPLLLVPLGRLPFNSQTLLLLRKSLPLSGSAQIYHPAPTAGLSQGAMIPEESFECTHV